jgi:hypothetical protein
MLFHLQQQHVSKVVFEDVAVQQLKSLGIRASGLLLQLRAENEILRCSGGPVSRFNSCDAGI